MFTSSSSLIIIPMPPNKLRTSDNIDPAVLPPTLQPATPPRTSPKVTELVQHATLMLESEWAHGGAKKPIYHQSLGFPMGPMVVFSVNQGAYVTPLLRNVNRLEVLNGSVVITRDNEPSITLNKGHFRDFKSPFTERLLIEADDFSQLLASGIFDPNIFPQDVKPSFDGTQPIIEENE